MKLTKDYLESLREELIGEVNVRWEELLEQYRNRLDEEFDELNIDGNCDDEDKRKIWKITMQKGSVDENLKRIEKLTEEEKEVCEFHKLKYSRGYVLLIGPVSGSVVFKLFK